ncbi:MAG TPA: porin family protein [Prolixibacteraceae bacterium]|nr:porin family protein [Prolixibacteraceae bacterium]
MKQKQLEKQNQYETNVVKVSSTHCIFNKLPQKMVVLMVIFMSLNVSSFAQVQWGVKVGPNASTQSEIGDICDDNDLKVGFNAGIIARAQMNDWMAIKSGLDYQLKGEKCDIHGEDSELETKLSYLVLPVKAEFSASEKAGFKNGQRLFFATGPYLGYLLDAKQTINGQITDLEDLNEVDFGWAFELGFEFPMLNTNALQISLNYDMGLRDVAKDADAQNKTASLNLGFLF